MFLPVRLLLAVEAVLRMDVHLYSPSTAMIHALHIVPAVLPTEHILTDRFVALPSKPSY